MARIHGVEPDTVLDWLHKAGQHCARLSEWTRGRHPQPRQVPPADLQYTTG